MTSTLPPDPWKALGVERNADKAEIRSAYKKLVLKCHPDKVQDPALKAQKQDEFQKVQQAYELLNDDAEKAKYEQKLKLAEMQRAAAKASQEVKNPANTSAPRSSPRYATYDIRTAEPESRYKSRSSPSTGKVYAHYASAHSRSDEDAPSPRVYPLYEETDREKERRRKKEEEERRLRKEDEERRRRKEEEELNRLREERDRERAKAEREKEARRAEKKRLEKERERERRRDSEEKGRRHKPYVEPYADAYAEELWAEDEKFVTSRPEKKRSSSKKHDEARGRDREREREKSSSRRSKSPSVPPSERKHLEHFEHAASYIASSGGSAPSQIPAFWKSQSPPESFLAPPAPTPPPVDFEDESIRHAAARAAGRRSSHDAARSREKLSKEKLKYEAAETPTKSRPIPTLSKSYSTPPPAPESPPRISRSHTTPHEPYGRPIPPLSRTQTWTAGVADYYDAYESDDDRDRRHRRSRRTRSPAAEAVRYKVEGTKTSKLEAQYSYGESPTSRRYTADLFEAHSPTYVNVMGTPYKVKESRAYDFSDVKYSEYTQPSYYTGHGTDGYTVMA